MKLKIIIFNLLFVIFFSCSSPKYSSYYLNYTNIMYDYRPCDKLDSPYIKSLSWQPTIYLNDISDTLKIYYTINLKCDTNDLYVGKILSYEILDISLNDTLNLSNDESKVIKDKLISYFTNGNWCLRITYIVPSKYSYFDNGICKWHSFGYICPIK